MSEEHQGTKKDSSELYSKLGTWSSVLSVILLLVIALQLGDLGKSLKGGTVQAGNDAPAIQPGDSAPAPTVDMAKLVDDDPMLGNKNAPVTIVEFSDFECPYCGRFHSQTFPQIKQEYIDTGKVRFVYRDFPLGPRLQTAPTGPESTNNTSSDNQSGYALEGCGSPAEIRLPP